MIACTRWSQQEQSTDLKGGGAVERGHATELSTESVRSRGQTRSTYTVTEQTEHINKHHIFNKNCEHDTMSLWKLQRKKPESLPRSKLPGNVSRQRIMAVQFSSCLRKVRPKAAPWLPAYSTPHSTMCHKLSPSSPALDGKWEPRLPLCPWALTPIYLCVVGKLDPPHLSHSSYF